MAKSSIAVVAALVASLGCDASKPVAASSAPLREAPAWLAAARTLDTRGPQRIVAGPPLSGAPQTDLRPAQPLAYFDGASFHEPPAPSWVGRVTARGAVWVTVREELVDQTGGKLDTEVAPEIALSADGLRVAYTRGFPNSVHIVDLATGARTNATPAMRDANQPLFHGDNRLIVCGARADEIYGVWVVDLDGAPPRAITNGDLRVGGGLGPSFVPPPARHESMRIVGETLVYDDGVGERSVHVGPPR